MKFYIYMETMKNESPKSIHQFHMNCGSKWEKQSNKVSQKHVKIMILERASFFKHCSKYQSQCPVMPIAWGKWKILQEVATQGF